MPGDESAYAALGLAPGADRAAVERAYRTLIKDHHPDRPGGDSGRAAEINRAYRELRDEPPGRGELVIDHWPALARRRRFGTFTLLLGALALAAVALLLAHGHSAPLRAPVLAPSERRHETGLMRSPIAFAGVDSAARTALQIATSGDEMSLSAVSRSCHDGLRAQPSLALLDRCAAFDDAVVVLQDRDPFRDRGPFSEIAVTSRQWSAAKAMSGDAVAIDSRLDQIRLRVELALAAMRQQPVG